MFDMIPVIVRRNHNIQPNTKLLMGVIISLNRGKLGCIASNQYLANELGVSLSSLKRYLLELKEHDYILIDSHKRNNSKKDIRVIVPGTSILPTIETAVSNVAKFDSSQGRKEYEPDWLDELMTSF